MIQQTYAKLEQSVDSIDEKIQSQYQDLLKSFFAMKYSKLASCLDAIPAYDESAVRQCSDKMNDYELNFKTELETQKRALYNCINTNYQSSFKDTTTANASEKYDKNLNLCLSKFEQDIYKYFKTLDKKLKSK